MADENMSESYRLLEGLIGLLKGPLRFVSSLQ